MSVRCLICGQVFEKLITSTHLKKHNMLTSVYIDKFGKEALSSPEYRKEKSARNSGSNNPNYGNKMSDESKDNISKSNTGRIAWNRNLKYNDTSRQKESARVREGKYKTGELQRHRTNHSADTKKKISHGVKEYASLNKDEMHARALQSIETKKSKGIDLAFFRGKKHTDESKFRISEKSKKYAKLKSEKSVADMCVRLDQLGFSVISSTSTEITAACNKCRHEISYTKQMFQPSKIREDLCPRCYPPLINRSRLEDEVFAFVGSLVECKQAYRFDNSRRTIDIFVPSRNIGIEVNGLYWHSQQVLESNGYSKVKDFEKLKDINNVGIRLIQIFEDEWINNREVVKSRLKRIIGIKFDRTIYARHCVIREISSEESSVFCNSNHLQGNGRSNVRLGLYLDKELISVMTFSKSNLSRKVAEWELNRFCSVEANIPGAASKLFSYFVKKYSPNKVITYADRRWSDGNVYTILGFEFDKYTVPNYWYIMNNSIKRIHRFSLRKTENDPADVTEKNIRIQQGYKIIYDSGSSKWVWIA